MKTKKPVFVSALAPKAEPTTPKAKPIKVEAKAEPVAPKAEAPKAVLAKIKTTKAPKAEPVAPKVEAPKAEPVAPKVEAPTSATFGPEAVAQYKELTHKSIQLKLALAEDLAAYKQREQSALQTLDELQKMQNNVVRAELQKLGMDPSNGPLKLDLETFQVTRQD